MGSLLLKFPKNAVINYYQYWVKLLGILGSCLFVSNLPLIHQFWR